MLPTGSGKTFIARTIAKKSAKRVLFLAPTIELLDQTIEDFKELSPQTIHSTSKYDEKERIFISTLQTISQRSELLDILKIDLIIIDEIHYGASGKMQELIREKHKGCFIGLSATPYDINGVLLSGFDKIIDKYDLAYMVKNKYLCDVEAVAPLTLDLKSVSITAGDYNLKELDFKMNTPAMLKAVTDATMGILAKRNKIIVFAVSISHAKALAKIYKSRTTMSVELLHSEQTKEKRKQVIERFKNKTLDMIISINMITTGFNSPNTDTVVIARPTRSQNLYKQMVGRGMRLFPGKKSMLLVDCGNVCASLGMPLDPIKEKQAATEKQTYECSECGSKKPRVKGFVNSVLHTHCPDCLGNPKPYIEREPSYTCERCSAVQNSESLIINKYGIFISCVKCKKISILEMFEDIEWGGSSGDNKSIFIDTISSLVLSYIPIFFKDSYLELLEEDVQQNTDRYLAALLENEKDVVGIYRISQKGISYKKFEKMINELQIRELRALSLRYAKDSAYDIDIEKMKEFILQEEKEYVLKHGLQMGPLGYKNASLRAVKALSNSTKKQINK